jgi:hypothetical protein
MNTYIKLVLCLALGIAACLAKAQEVPKHLELARELVATVKPENNNYSYKGFGIRMKGDLFASENSVSTMCAGFVQSVLERVHHPAISTIKANGEWGGRGFLRVSAFYTATENQKGLTKIADLRQVRPGDILVIWCKDICSSVEGPAQGHVALVDTVATAKEPTPPLHDNTLQWTVSIIDVNDYPHDLKDTRYAKGGPKITGVGRGTIRIYTDADGNVKGYTEGPRGPKFNSAEVRPLVFGRLQ